MIALNDRLSELEDQDVIDSVKAFRSPATFASRFSRKDLGYDVDCSVWTPTRHLSVIDYEFQNLLVSPSIDILIVTMPVRHGKSEYLSRWATTWHKLRYPYKNIMLCSNTAKLATKHSMWVRNAVHKLGPIFGVKGVDATNASKSEWKLDGSGMGGCIAAGTTGSIVGMPADLLMIDDYLKDAKSAYSQSIRDQQWDWFLSTSSTRLEPGGKCVILCTRWHPDDLIGRILENREELGFRVRYINMQALRDSSAGKDPLGRQDGEALWPDRWPAEVMERRKRNSLHWWFPIYQGRPKQGGMSSWPEEYFYNLWCDEDEWPGHMGLSASAFDPSKGGKSKIGDYQASVYVGYSNGKFYVDAELDRRSLTQMIRGYVAFNKERKPAVAAIEGNAFQELLKDDYEQACEDVGYHADPPLMISNMVNKNLRIERLGKFLDARMIRFRRTAGCELLVRQLKDFPNGKYDDGCFIAGTMVLTVNGPKPIEHVQVGDRLITRKGIGIVTVSGCTGAKPVIGIECESGRTIIGTHDHPVLSGNSFTRMDSASTLEALCQNKQPNQNASSSMESRLGDTHKPDNGHIACTILLMPDIAGKALDACTKKFGSRLMAISKMAIRFITSTRIRSTTRSTISHVSQKPSMMTFTKKPDQLEESNRTWHRCWKPRKNGTSRKLAENGIQSMPKSNGSLKRCTIRFVRIAVNFLKRRFLAAPCSAIQRADNDSTQMILDSARNQNIPANTAELNLSHSEESELNSVATSVSPDRVIRREEKGIALTFNLTVDVGEYVANGFVVHNCDALEQAIRALCLAFADLAGLYETVESEI